MIVLIFMAAELPGPAKTSSNTMADIVDRHSIQALTLDTLLYADMTPMWSQPFAPVAHQEIRSPVPSPSTLGRSQARR